MEEGISKSSWWYVRRWCFYYSDPTFTAIVLERWIYQLWTGFLDVKRFCLSATSKLKCERSRLKKWARKLVSYWTKILQGYGKAAIVCRFLSETWSHYPPKKSLICSSTPTAITNQTRRFRSETKNFRKIY